LRFDYSKISNLRTLPPTAAPVLFGDLLSGIFSRRPWSDEKAELAKKLCSYFGVDYALTVSSGKAAISLTLGTLKQITPRQEVIIPAYTSYCLASAVARSGLSVRLCDLNPRTLDFDYDNLERIVNENTLAVIVVHNYGLVSDLRQVKAICKKNGTWIVEDAAQAAGASFEESRVGAVGDVGILSFGRGKNICALGGGVVLTRNPIIAKALNERLQSIPPSSIVARSGTLFTGLALSLLLNPKAYSVPARIPFLGIGANIFDPGFTISKLSLLNTRLAIRVLPYLDQYNIERIRNATALKQQLREFEGCQIPESNGSSRQPVYLRFPVLIKNRQIRDDVFQVLSDQRMGASLSYPQTLDQIKGFRPYLALLGAYPGAQEINNSIVTLPTHRYVQNKDLEAIVAIIKRTIF
jgi:dTDP-4-amino-4,6-dideoxygalactose transaminase